MGRALLCLALALVAAPAGAQRYEIRPRIFDLNPHDGFLDPGSFTNPYELRGPQGVVGTIRPRVFDLDPADGFLDPGSVTNPYELELEE
jgi:hypothetical protein